MAAYDTDNHQITGVSQHGCGGGGDVSFSSTDGDVLLGSLKVAG